MRGCNFFSFKNHNSFNYNPHSRLCHSAVFFPIFTSFTLLFFCTFHSCVCVFWEQAGVEGKILNAVTAKVLQLANFSYL